MVFCSVLCVNPNVDLNSYCLSVLITPYSLLLTMHYLLLTTYYVPPPNGNVGPRSNTSNISTRAGAGALIRPIIVISGEF